LTPSENNTIDQTAFPEGLRLVAKLAREGMLVVREGIMAALNRSMAQMCGYAPEALAGRSLDALLDPTAKADFTQWAEEVIRNGSNNGIEHRTSFRHKQGHSVPALCKAGPVRHCDQPAALFLVTDLTEVTEAENRLQKARQLESIAALSGGIAHDYNNLLTVIIGNISLVQSYIDPEDLIYRMLTEAYEASMIAKSLTQKLITFSRGGAPRKEVTDLAPLLKSVTEFSLSGANVKVTFDLTPGLHHVEADKTQMGQAFHNLVINAREAMPDGGMITVSACNVQKIDGVESTAAAGWVRICIADQGHGIAAEHLDRVFDPYFSTKQRGNQKGTGLGLSICHSIVKNHGGMMSVASEVDNGTRVFVCLPATTKPLAILPAHQRTSAPPVDHKGGRILVMDDEAMILKLAGLILTRLGYRAAFAADGREAVDRYREALEQGRPFDAVILDLTVRGGMGGEEAIRHLREIDPGVVAIVSSGYSDSPVLTEHERFGFRGAVVKPYSVYELSDALKRFLACEDSVPARTDQ
jgi:PAS domain S-box-containing protein